MCINTSNSIELEATRHYITQLYPVSDVQKSVHLTHVFHKQMHNKSAQTLYSAT